MTKLSVLGVALCCLSLVVVQESSAGGVPVAQFNTFSFIAAGPITDLSVGESAQTGQLSTTFDIGMGAGPISQFSLGLIFSGPGALTVTGPIPDLGTACVQDTTEFNCSFQGAYTFDPGGLIVPGTPFGAMGQILFGGITPPVLLAEREDSFESFAAVPEPAAFALLCIGLFALGLARGKPALQQT